MPGTVAEFELDGMPPLEADSFVPLYAQLADLLAGRILRDPEVLPGAIVPSEAQCAAYFKVSRPTVRQAMAQLTSRGLISRGRGRGTFVAPQARMSHDLSRAFEDELQQTDRTARFDILTRETIDAPQKVRETLRLAPSEQVERIVRVRLVEDEPFGYEERFIPARFASRVSESSLLRKPMMSLIKEYTGEFPAHSSYTIRSLRASKAVAGILGLATGAPILSSEHWYALANSERVIYGTVLFHGDRYQFTVETDIQTG